jgi:TolB-like protein/DNA-binding winged helix-turn-helix (wHTH) protein/Tfp pilus assembly protein PilF
MDSRPHQSRVLKFGVFEVDLELRELRKSGLRIKLAGQPFEVLRMLLERPQQLVTREELQRRLWPKNTFVDYELALKKAVNRIREVLGDDAHSPRFIETIPRRGYQFIAPISEKGDALGVVLLPPAESPKRQHKLKFVLLLGTGTCVLVLAVLGFVSGKLSRRGTTAGATPAIRSLAVLPLQNLPNDATQEYFSDGMTDALITELAQIGSLKVISRTSSMQYKQTKKKLPEIARELDVDGIIEGTVQRYGDRVRITAQLIEGTTDNHVWAKSYEGDAHDALALERQVTEDVARQIQAHLERSDQRPPAQSRRVNSRVLDTYLEGNYHLHRFSRGAGDEEKRKASELFQQVIDAEPDFAQAYVGMARAHYELSQGSSEDTGIVRRAAEKAVQLDPASSDAWETLAAVKEHPFWDWSGAEHDYQKAITLGPSNAAAHEGFCNFLGEMGQLDEGLKECDIAQQLDPNEDHLALILYLRREYDRSIAGLEMMLKLHPNDGSLHAALYQDYAKKGMYKESIQHLSQTSDLFGFPEAADHIHRAFARSGFPAVVSHQKT